MTGRSRRLTVAGPADPVGGPPDGGDGSARPPRRRDPQVLTALRIRRALTLLALTLIAPGCAQVVMGPSAASEHRPGLSRVRLRVARTCLRLWVGLGGLGLVLAGLTVLHQDWATGLFSHQMVLRPLAVLLLAAAVLWPLLLLDAWRIGQAPELTARSRRWIALAAAVGLAVTCTLPAVLGHRAWTAADPSAVEPTHGRQESAGTLVSTAVLGNGTSSA